MTIPAKYHSNLASGSREEKLKSFLYRHIREMAPPPGGHVYLDIIMNLVSCKRVILGLFLPKII